MPCAHHCARRSLCAHLEEPAVSRRGRRAPPCLAAMLEGRAGPPSARGCRSACATADRHVTSSPG
eukprot:4806443-Prymnesium_polylepis.1